MFTSFFKISFAIACFLSLAQMGYTQEAAKLNTASLNTRLTAYLASPEVKQSKSLDGIFDKVVPGSIKLVYKSGAVELSYAPKGQLSPQETNLLESELKTKILENLLGNFQGGLVGTKELETLLKKSTIFSVVSAPATLVQPTPLVGFDINLFKKRFDSLLANPDAGNSASVSRLNSLVKVDTDRIEWVPGKSLKVLYTPLSSGPLSDDETKEVESIIKGRLVSSVLGNYQGGMVSQKDFNEIMSFVSVEKFRNAAEVVGLERTPDWWWDPQSINPRPSNTQWILIRGQVHPLRTPRVGIAEQVDPIDPNLSSAKAYGMTMDALKAKRSSLALALLNHLMKDDASNPVYWFLKAVALYDLGRDAEGIEAAKKAGSLVGRAAVFQSVGSSLESIQGPRREFLKYAVTGVWVP